MRAQAQYTIHTVNDVVTSGTAPASPYLGQLWVDTAQSPPITKVWNGSAWVEQNGTDTIRTTIKTLETKEATLESTLSGLKSSVSSVTKQVEVVEDSLGNVEENVLSVQESVSLLEQTASSIELRVASNEKNISTLSISQSSLEARVKTAEGNISSLKTDVSGIKTRVSNTEGAVTELEQTASSLKTRVQNSEGKITTLTTDVNGLKAKVRNAEGSISSLEQTASGLIVQVSDAEENITALTSTVEGLKTRVSNAEGDISSLEQTASGLTTRVSNAEGNLSTLTSTVNGLKTRVSNAEGDISTLEQTTSELSATVASKVDESGGSTSSFGWSLTSSGFSLYSNSRTVMTVTKDGLGIRGTIYATGGTIAGFTIGSTAIYNKKTAYNNTTSGVYLGTDGIGLGAGTFYVTSSGALRATSATVDGTINATSGTLSELTITGSLYFGNNDEYYLNPNYDDDDYYIYLPGLIVDDSGAVFSGHLSAPSGTIGGFTISTSKLYKTKASYGDSNNGVYLGTDGIGLGAGAFYVTSSGYLYSTNATVTGTINATGGTFKNVEVTGSIYLGESHSYFLNPNVNNGSWYIYLPKFRVDDSSAYFSGTLQAPGGTIGGFTISTSKLYKTKTSYSDSNDGVYVGTDGIGLGAGAFYVTSTGYLYATSGKIGGMNLTSSQLYSQNFILGTVYNSNNSSQSFTTLSFGSTSGSTFTATTVLTNSGCYMQSLSSNTITSGIVRVQSVRADASISSSTGFYFGYSGGSTQYYAELSWSGSTIFLKIYNSNGTQTSLSSAKSFTVHYACIWGSDNTWTATVSAGSSSTSLATGAFWGIDYATFNYSSTNKAQHTYYFTVSGSSAYSTITCYGHIVPWYNNNYDLGSVAYKWRNIYGQAGIVNTSDKNEKFDISPLATVYDRIFDRLIPVSFKFIDNTSNRTHVGLIAQDVKEAILAEGLTTREFAGYCEWENEDTTTGCGLRYSEFVAMNIFEIQQLKAQVKDLQAKLQTMEEQHNETQ